MEHSVSGSVSELTVLLREKLDPLGCSEGEAGAFQTGHVPHVAPLAYLCVCYSGLNEEGLQAAEEECGRYIPDPYREFLACMNGASILGVSLFGTIFGAVDRSGLGIGQPISLRYGNVVERPGYIPQGHLGIGGINGERYSQGALYLASTGEVEFYNSHANMIGAKWESFSNFLNEEMPRRLSLYDERGFKIKGAKHLPGDTEDWERLGKEEYEKRTRSNNSFIGRAMRSVRRK